jgi:hypothetical protein
MASTVNAENSYDGPRVPVIVDVVPYDPAHGVLTWWNDGAVLRMEISSEFPEGTVVISGNPEGLHSLARHLLALAQRAVPDGSHFDFDYYFGWLEAGSPNLRIEVEK